MMKTYNLSEDGKKRIFDSLLNSLDCGQCFFLVEAIDHEGIKYRGTSRMDDNWDRINMVTVMDKEDDKEYTFPIDKLYDAWWKITSRQLDKNGKHHCHISYSGRISELGFDPENADTDAYDDDILVQVAVFDEVIYG